MTDRIPNFRGMSALILHRQDRNTAALEAQLRKLGVRVAVQWPARGPAEADADVAFFDADRGFDALFPWGPGEAPIPLIAMVGTEAPGRLEWMLAQNPTGFIQKPISSSGAFQALVVGFHLDTERRNRERVLRTQADRLKARPLVVRAVLLLMRIHAVCDDEAFRMLRTQAMRQQISVEEAAYSVVSSEPQQQRAGGLMREVTNEEDAGVRMTVRGTRERTGRS